MGPMPDDVLVYKKYPNRRLYDTQKSIYVTLNEVAEVIRGGREVRIVDAKTREDVTAFILTQIVLEEAKNKNALLPAPLLHLIIRYGDNLLVEFFEKYFQQTLQNFIAHRQAVDIHFQQWLEMGMNMSKIAQKSLAEMNPFQTFFESLNPEKKKKEEKE